MLLKKKTKETGERTTPIFPIYLNTMRIKDTIAILEDGISSMRSVTNEIVSEKDNSVGSKVEGSLYKIALEIGNEIKSGNINKHNEHFDKIHTDASLFNKILVEFIANKRIKNINCKEDLENVNEGQIVLCEGRIHGNELETVFNQFYVFAETMGAMGNKEAKEILKQLSGIEKILVKDERITDISNMLCKLEDGTNLITVVENKYLLNESGVELIRGKYKILGIVYEKIPKGCIVNLARDGILGLFKFEDIEKMYATINNAFLSARLDMPQVRTSIEGPSIGILPLGIYL